MKDNSMPNANRRMGEYILCYIFWILLAGSTIWLLIDAQSNLMLPVRLNVENPSVVTIINYTSLVLIGFTALFFIILLEHYLRIGVDKGKFWPRLARAIILEAIIVAIAYIAAPLLVRVLL